MHHAGSNPMHKWYARQGPGGAASDAPTALAPTRGTGSSPVPSDDGGDNGGDNNDEDSSSSSSSVTETSRTRSTPSSSSTTSPSTSSTRSSTSSIPSETSDPVVTTTIQSTSTSTSFSTESTPTSESSTTLEEETTEASTTALTTPPTTTGTRTLVTSFVTASASIPTLASSATNSLASSGSGSDSSGPSAGTVVGIVAGALVGVVVLSGIIGYVFRTKCNNKNDEDDFDGENPFGNMDDGFGGRAGASRAELRRDSQLLGGDDGDSIHQMSEMGHGGSYGNLAAAAGGAGAAGAYALNRGNSTSLPGLQRQDTVNPRPPTMIQRHYANMHAGGAQTYPDMPSFQPGQLVYPSSTMNQSSPYPTFQPGGASSVPIGGVFPSSASGHGHDQQYGQQQHFQDYTTNQDYGRQESDMPARTGTPEYANPQQYFHQASESFSSGTGMNPSPFGDHNASAAGGMQQYPAQREPQNADYLSSDHSYPQGATPREKAMSGNERAKRTLSVRNGGAYDEDGILRESVYGGM